MSDTHKKQLIVISPGLCACARINFKDPNKDSAKIIQGFDFTCTQVVLHGDGCWWRNPQKTVTPAFLFSLLTGKMYMSFFNVLTHIGGWPFTDLNTIFGKAKV